MILHTGGVAVGDISTKSKPTCSALAKATSILTIPACCPSESIKRISFSLICRLIRTFFLLSPRG